MGGGRRLARRDRARLTASEGRRFALVVGAAFAALGALLLWRGHERFAVALLFTSGLTLSIIGVVVAVTIDGAAPGAVYTPADLKGDTVVKGSLK